MLENNSGSKWEIGETLKAIRLSSGMKQTEVYSNVMSRAHLQRIEKNVQTPTYPLLLNVIQKFSMDVDEFEYIRNDYSLSETQTLFHKFRSIKTTLNTDAMRNLIQEVNDYLLKNKSAFIQNLHYILNGT
ncbi:helix-turn-helix transcriptional regulator [Listeria weihenstephanensis]|uniref:Helix-turn-helix transcriptional regulator n=1 Tax=Listeria weihenstephanensis TaxID=1006155 RepID=A0A841ZBF6_9LIST|nr:helix-turn-helix transcriptional regulator [Listeria weihenstephanensis]MBC1501846.1 helix-turn-helix transcriptional regulator [Listeria weihenstephanensis]